MHPTLLLMGILGSIGYSAASPLVSTKTCYTSPPRTITKLVSATCPAPPAPVTVYLDANGNPTSAPTPTVVANYVTTLPAIKQVTQVVYPSTMVASAGETVTISGVPTVVSQAVQTFSNCPCQKATTVYAPGPVITLPAAYNGGSPGGAVGGNGAGGAVGGAAVGPTTITTNIVFPTAFAGNSGDTIIINGNPTYISAATYIENCPCTFQTTLTIAAPVVTQFVPITTVVAGATVTSTATVVSGVTVTAAPTAAATNLDTVDGVTFLIEEQTNYDTTPLALAKNKRQTTIDTLQVCLKTCADADACVGTSFNTELSVCLYFSAIVRSSRRTQVEITFATVISRITPSGTSRLSSSASSTSSSAASTSSKSSSSTSASGTSSSGTSTSSTSTSGTSTTTSASSTTASQTADPSSDPDPTAPVESDLVVRAAAPKATGLSLREAQRNKAGAVVRRGGVLRRSNAEPAAKRAPRKVVIEL